MTNGASSKQVGFLITVVTILLGVVVFIAGWSKIESTQVQRDLQEYKEKQSNQMQVFRESLPATYVRYEQYRADCERNSAERREIKEQVSEVKSTVKDVDRKLDRLLLHNKSSSTSYGRGD